MTDNDRPRLRDFGVEPGTFEPGPGNAVTDVPSVAVGHETLVAGDPEDPPCVRTGVTAVDVPDRNLYREPLVGATHVINGYGKSTGFAQVNELGRIETPLLLTNTLNVWRVADALVDHVLDSNPDALSINPVVGECNDGRLNDIQSRYVGPEHVHSALESASADTTAEGVVGAGTGTVGYGWKAGIGTSSRRVSGHTLGALVLVNTGQSRHLRVEGHHVGASLTPPSSPEPAEGSIMMLVGTDAPLDHRQLERVARRTTFGLARTGSAGQHGSGDFAVAFTTHTGGPALPEESLDPLFEATVEAVEEAVVNSVLRAETVVGTTTTAHAIPVNELRGLLGD